MNAILTLKPELAVRRIVHRTRGHGHGPITRLMSPSDLGQLVKPFVFLDIFDADRQTVEALAGMPVHPHSGIATVTVPVEGAFHYDDPDSGTSGTLAYGGVEWSRAGGGMWHGKELSAADTPRIQGFQLWVALPPELENGKSESRYIEAKDIRQAGPAHVIVGNHEGVQSPVPAPDGFTYLLVTLKPGERWAYQPPAGHTVGWLALARGKLDAGVGGTASAGEMVVFEPGEAPIVLEAAGKEGAVFVLGSAVPHPYSLHLGYYSVHTSAQALEAGESRIAELGRKLKEAGDRRTASGTIPVFR
ncbi:pirin family protein [Dickeya dianthicola]|uniref:pirin family protein n=1 Tax=Dickeya dianthicola TaxID=204039 RepID=UPI00186687DE|nr:pirin family protein [Dickeya dianthicola]QOL13463.1 pirin family protein [Dickeya dianthicola]